MTVRVRDRVGNRGESAPVTIRVPGTGRPGDALTGSLPGRRAAGRRRRPGRTSRGRTARCARSSARRGVRLKAKLRVARSRSGWRQLLGGPAADRYAGYADLRGTVLLGPAATAGIASIRGAQGGAREPLARRHRGRGDGARGAPARDDPRHRPGVADRLPHHEVGARVRGGVHRGGDRGPALRLRHQPEPAARGAGPARSGRGAALRARVRAGGGVRAADVTARDEVARDVGEGARVADPGGRHVGRQPVGAAVATPRALARRCCAGRRPRGPPGAPCAEPSDGAGAAAPVRSAAPPSAPSGVVVGAEMEADLGAAALGGPPVHVGEVGHDQPPAAADRVVARAARLARRRGRRRGGRGRGRGPPRRRRRWRGRCGSPRPARSRAPPRSAPPRPPPARRPAGRSRASPRSRSWAKIHSRARRAASGDAGTRDVRVERESGGARGRSMVRAGPGHDGGVVPGRRVATRAAVAWNGVRGRLEGRCSAWTPSGASATTTAPCCGPRRCPRAWSR